MLRSLIQLGILLTAALPLAAQTVDGPPTAPDLAPLWARIGDSNGESGAVEVAVFSPDGRFIASGSKYDNQIMLWRAVDGTLVWSAPVNEEVEAIAFSPDGEWLASGGEDAVARIWSVREGKQVRALPHDTGIDGLAWSHNGRLLVTGEEGREVGAGKTGHATVRFWSMPEGRLLGTVDHGGSVNSVDFTQDDALVVTAGINGEARLWRVADRALLRTMALPGVSIKSVRLSPDDSLVATGSTQGVIALWRISDGTLVKRFRYPHTVEAVEFSREGSHLVAGGSGPNPIWILRVPTLELLRSIPQTLTEYLDFTGNGAQLVSAHEDGTVRTWLWRSGDPALNQRLHEMLTRRQAEAAARRGGSEP